VRLFAVLCLLLPLFAAPAAALESQARAVILVDADTGTILFEKNADQRMAPASMSKILTAYVVFKHLTEGRLSLSDEMLVSEKAWRMEGSKMWIEVGERVTVDNLLHGLIIQSGNDAAVALAEGISGSEEAFAKEMNEQAAAWGLTDTNFRNSTGWPDPEHYTTARDLAVMARHLIQDFPDFYKLYSIREFTWANITQQNRNPLLGRGLGVDGIKTGHTEEAGYCLAASGVQDGQRLILIVFGLPNEKTRAEEAERLLAWGFREFESYTLFKGGEVLDVAPVFMGEEDQVELVAPHDLDVRMLRSARAEMKVTLRYQSPLQAPLAAGQEVAVLSIEAPGIRQIDLPVVTAKAVDEAGLFGRMMEGVLSLVD
jgi:serine-type D-Ala-D-Ala carboxypeptidase (penicillin-binding protein 5/6)